MTKRERVAQHDERKAMAVVGQILGKGFGRDSEYGFLKLPKSDLSKVHADPRAKKAGVLFSKAGDEYLDAGKYSEARTSYMSAIETYTGNNPRQDTSDEARFRKYCTSKSKEADTLQHEKDSELQEKLQEGHDRIQFGLGHHALPASLAIIGLIGGLFFLSSNLTGNIIGLNQSSSSWIGAVLLVVGLVGSFFWFRNRKR